MNVALFGVLARATELKVVTWPNDAFFLFLFLFFFIIIDLFFIVSFWKKKKKKKKKKKTIFWLLLVVVCDVVGKGLLPFVAAHRDVIIYPSIQLAWHAMDV